MAGYGKAIGVKKNMPMSDNAVIAERLAVVCERIEKAAQKSGRQSDDIVVVAVSKGFPPEVVEEAHKNGLYCFGENKVQEAKQKIPLCSGDIEWHMVGHLQSNKTRDAVRLFAMVHSVDSLELLEKLNNEAEKAGKVMPICLQVNVSGERSKFGMKPEEVESIIKAADSYHNVVVRGLMTIPPYSKDPEMSRPFFRKLADLRNLCQGVTGRSDLGLSMGMSEDFEIAIEEGANWIRIGRAIFGDRPKKVPVIDGETL